jgi:hypothetical protein
VIRDLLLAHGDDPALGRLRPYQRHALAAIASCGTVAAGVHREACDHCGDRRMVPNTCGHRGCPHCQARERAAWVEARTAELLPCGYFHAVLTLPPELRAAAAAFPTAVLGALMRAASDAIDRLGRDPRFLGAEVGQLAVLHTWTRDLRWHPHVHVIVTAGGWDAQRQRWIPAKTYGRERRAFLMPVDVLKAAFAGRLRSLLLREARAGAFGDGGGLPELRDADALARHLAAAMQRPWVIRIEPPFGGPRQLLKYLGAYVNRTAVSPKRVTYDHAAGTATLTWSANATPGQVQTTTMPAREFILRFAQHILPPGFQRIRFRGLWSTAHRSTKLDAARPAAAADPTARPDPEPPAPSTEPRRDRCPVCGQGHYQRLPGRCPRLRPRERDRILGLIRRGAIHPIHGEVRVTA